jgi:hypothetical protein
MLELHERPTKADVEAVMKDRVVEQTELMGRYERQ